MCRFQKKTKQYTSKITTKAKKQKTKKFTSFQYISPSGSSESGSLQKENCRSEKKKITTGLSNMFIITLERHAETYSEDTELRKVKVFLSKKTKNDLLQTADIIYQLLLGSKSASKQKHARSDKSKDFSKEGSIYNSENIKS